jgi:hypothetical protein
MSERIAARLSPSVQPQPHASPRRAKGRPLTPELLEALRAAAAELGEPRLIVELGLDGATVARAVSGFAVYPGTVAAVKLFLADRRAA